MPAIYIFTASLESPTGAAIPFAKLSLMFPGIAGRGRNGRKRGRGQAGGSGTDGDRFIWMRSRSGNGADGGNGGKAGREARR